MPTDKTDTLAAFERRRISAIIRTDDADLAHRAMEAAVQGGFRLVEFTLTTPEALRLIAEFSAMDNLIAGAGTVLTTEQARRAVEAGARFIVSPVCDPSVITEANGLGAVTVPGTFTATEMMTAHRAGADMVKLFPSPGIGPEYVRAMLGPLDFLKIFPTAGITGENFLEYLSAGAVGVAFTTNLFVREDLAARNYERIRERAADIVARLKASPYGGDA